MLTLAKLSTPFELLGFKGLPFKANIDNNWPEYRKIFTRGIQMYKNIIETNFRGWRIFANVTIPIIPISGDVNIFEIEKLMVDSFKSNKSNFIKVLWNDKYLVVTNILKKIKLYFTFTNFKMNRYFFIMLNWIINMNFTTLLFLKILS